MQHEVWKVTRQGREAVSRVLSRGILAGLQDSEKDASWLREGGGSPAGTTGWVAQTLGFGTSCVLQVFDGAESNPSEAAFFAQLSVELAKIAAFYVSRTLQTFVRGGS